MNETLSGPARFRRWLHGNLPKSALLRVPIGVLLVIFGILGFLPIVGFWMIPLGLAVLAIDFPPARRWARRFTVWIGRAWQRARGVTPRSRGDHHD